jgi:hypothetical protein
VHTRPHTTGTCAGGITYTLSYPLDIISVCIESAGTQPDPILTLHASQVGLAQRVRGAGCTRELGSSQKCPQNTWKLLGRNSSSAQLEDGSRAFLPQRSFPSPSQRRQLDNFNYFDDGGIADRRCGPSAGPRPPRQCAKLTSQSSRQKRSGAGSPSNVWGKGSSSLLHLLSDCMQVD